MMALTWFFQGINTAPGHRTTTIVLGFAAATCGDGERTHVLT